VISHITLHILTQLHSWASFLMEYQICLINSSMLCWKSPRSRAHASITHFFPPFWATVTIFGPGIFSSAATGGIPGTVTETVQSPVRRISAGDMTGAAVPSDEIPHIAAATNIACVDISRHRASLATSKRRWARRRPSPEPTGTAEYRR